MLHYIAHYIEPSCLWLHVLSYISTQSIGALLSSLFLWILMGNYFLWYAQRFFCATTREWTPQNHKLKGQVPTMGGIFILITTLMSCLVWNHCTWHLSIALSTIIAFACLGYADDWYKIKKQQGICARTKFLVQILLAVLCMLGLYATGFSYTIYIPFLKSWYINNKFLHLVWAVFIIVAMSNAVNLTDGLDGLAVGSLIPTISVFSGICYLANNTLFSDYLYIAYSQCDGMPIMGASILGSCLGFLWYNAYPAQLFMGDVGSLSLGAALGILALMSKQEYLLVLAGGVFFAETLSVIIQVIYFKRTRKRWFKMAPLHHHFELLGWHETKITTRFSIISLILCLLALISLKIR